MKLQLTPSATQARWIIFLVALAAAGLGVMARYHWSGVSNTAVSDPKNTANALLALTLFDVHDKPQPLGQWRGKPLVINFWATWCPPCREEMPLFDRAARDFAADGVQFVGISIDDLKAAKDYAQANPTAYPLLLGTMDMLGLTQSLGNTASALPFTVLIAPNGAVHAVKLGPYRNDELNDAVKNLSALRAVSG